MPVLFLWQRGMELRNAVDWQIMLSNWSIVSPWITVFLPLMNLWNRAIALSTLPCREWDSLLVPDTLISMPVSLKIEPTKIRKTLSSKHKCYKFYSFLSPWLIVLEVWRAMTSCRHTPGASAAYQQARHGLPEAGQTQGYCTAINQAKTAWRHKNFNAATSLQTLSQNSLAT